MLLNGGQQHHLGQCGRRIIHQAAISSTIRHGALRRDDPGYGTTSGANCSGTIIDDGYNVSDDNSCGFSGTGSLNNAALNLGPLQDNGGPTQTHLPDAGSMAINRIPAGVTIVTNGVSYTCDQNGEALDTDQRGQPRPVNPGGYCDAGAVEASDQPGISVDDVTITEGDTGNGQCRLHGQSQRGQRSIHHRAVRDG